MMIKVAYIIPNILFFYSVIFPPIAQASKDDCQIIVQKKIIDYGHVARGNVIRDTFGYGELPKKNQSINVMCSNLSEITIDFDGIKQNQGGFSYGDKSSLNITVNSASIDGDPTLVKILRDNQLRDTSTVLPGDKVQPYPYRQGKNFILNLDLTPKIHLDEINGVDNLNIQGSVNVSSVQSNIDAFTIATTFSAVACTPLVSQHSVDYGQIKLSSLSNEIPTILEPKVIDFSITCDGPSYVAVRARSNRMNSTIDIDGAENAIGSARANTTLITSGLGKNQPLGLPNVTEPNVAGLGLGENGRPIGGYMLNLPFTLIYLDGETAKAKFWTTTLPTSSSVWAKNTTLQSQGDSLFSRTASYFSYGKDANTNTPSAFSVLNGSLIVQAYITAKQSLDLTSPIQLNGSASIELFYF